VLETRGLTVRFGGHVAVNAVSCAFQRGTLTAIVGPNGAGKTTYFNLISGQIPATAGEVFLFGKDISAFPRPCVPARDRPGLSADQPVSLPHRA
jgi:branched-chain amino acid transport system ATP-binding protein